MDSLIRFLILIVLLMALIGIGIYLNIEPQPVVRAHNDDEIIIERLDSLQAIIEDKVEQIKTVNQKKQSIKKYYYEKTEVIDTIIVDSILVNTVKFKIHQLSPARFD
ncbi:MAG: hypothetical protein KF721_04810 [Ignavibacteriaceae bacterium]|nr:hypothetical protein [Ignavibacteriaceae bacterium]